MKTFDFGLILDRDTVFDESITVTGNIVSSHSLTVKGDINARNIYTLHINAKNINALDIKAWNIDAENINAENIDAHFIICEKRIKKTSNSKTICYAIITNRFSLEKKEVGNNRYGWRYF